GNGEAIMRLGETQVVKRDPGPFQGLRPSAARPVEGGSIAARNRKEVVRMGRAPETDGARRVACRILGDEHKGCGAIANERAIAAAQGMGYIRVLIRDRVAELEA